MTPDNKRQEQQKGTDATGNGGAENSKESVRAAHEEAEKDMALDPDLSIHSPNDDLDEGETARLGEDTGGLI